jgi:hypothetical protein
MRTASLFVCVAVASLSGTASAQTIAGDASVQAQWFTGSLEAPSPALPKAGLFAFEPYLIFQENSGAYGGNGDHHSVRNDTSLVDSVEVLKYGITDQLSVEALPSFARISNDHSNFTGLGDLPVELEYRFNDEDNKTGFPSFTAALGMTFPTGDYNHLPKSLDGLGSGAYTLKEGILAQSLFDSWGHHPMRFRFYAEAFEPVANVSLSDISSYGTGEGFQGSAMPGFSSELGIGAGYGLDQRWVLALDLVQNFANGAHIRGAVGSIVDNSNAPVSAGTAVAPAVEYNWSDSIGVIAGVEFTVAGRNTASYIAPQVALAMSF